MMRHQLGHYDEESGHYDEASGHYDEVTGHQDIGRHMELKQLLILLNLILFPKDLPNLNQYGTLLFNQKYGGSNNE